MMNWTRFSNPTVGTMKKPEDLIREGLILDIHDTGQAVLISIRRKAPVGFMGTEVGHVRIRHLESCRAWEVMNSYALGGWGPFLYDLAMEYADQEGLVPDRGEVSPTALRVWNYYMRHRTDVWKFDLTAEVNNCVFHSDRDPSSWEPLDFRYVKKNRDLTREIEMLGLWPKGWL